MITPDDVPERTTRTGTKPGSWRWVKVIRSLPAWITVILGLATAIFGVMQYRRADQWRRVEFVIGYVDKFRSQPEVIASMQMLDWNASEVELGGSHHFVTDKDLSAALLPHTERPAFTPLQVAIRGNFDKFFDGLEWVDHFIDAGVVSTDDLAPYLGYWLEIIGNPDSGRKPPDLVRGIWRYLRCYRYEGVVSLLHRYGYTIDPTTTC